MELHEQVERLIEIWYNEEDVTESIELENLIKDLQEKQLSEIIEKLTLQQEN